MSTGLKVVLWIAGIIGVLVLIVVGAGVYLGMKAQGTMEEASDFAATTDKQGCLEELASRAANCNDVSCVMNGTMFGMGCLDAASGEQADVCLKDPSPNQQESGYCDGATNNEYCTTMIQTVLDQYCQ